MLLFRTILAGWKAAGKSDRVLLLYYLANLVFAGIAATSLYVVGFAELNFSLSGANLAGRFDLGAMLEFILRHHDFLLGSSAAVVGVVVLYVLMGIFLAGGTISLFVSGRTRYDPALFWGNCGYYFSPFVRLTLLAVPIYGAIAIWLFPQVSKLLQVFAGPATANGVALIACLALCAITFALFDFAKVNLVITGERHALSTFWQSLGAFLRRTFLSISFLLSFLAMNTFLFLLFSFLSDFLQEPKIAALLALIVLQQFFVVLRLKLRLAYFATIVELHPHLFLKAPARILAEIKSDAAEDGNRKRAKP